MHRHGGFDENYVMSHNVRKSKDRKVIEMHIQIGEEKICFYENLIDNLTKNGHKKRRKNYKLMLYRQRKAVVDMRKRLNAL